MNMNVTTRQGINWKVYEKKIPLYLKSLEFITRYFQTRHLAKEITYNISQPDDKLLALFQWTIDHIRPTPKELPTIDDHPWHIMVRGYGETDQMNDIFSILSSYAGFRSFFDILLGTDEKDKHRMAFVERAGSWRAFDVCHGVTFGTERGEGWASLEDIRNGVFSIHSYRKDIQVPDKNYYQKLLGAYVLNDKRMKRNREQKPFERLWIVLAGWIK